MTKEEVIQKIKEILAKDKDFNGADVEVIFKDKSKKKATGTQTIGAELENSQQ